MTIPTMQTDRKAIRKYSLGAVLTKTDRIISAQELRVRFTERNIAPAFTDGESIWIDESMNPISEALDKGFTPETLHIATALNYHELAHCMFMPRLDSSLVERVKTASAFFAFNILQDQADESKFVRLFDPAKDYFIRLVTSYMMESPEHLSSNYPLVAGRLFLPESLREKFKERFDNPELIDDIDELVAEYKRLVYPDDQVRMVQVIIEFNKLLKQMQDGPSISYELRHEELREGTPNADLNRQLVEEEKQEQDNQEEGDSGSEVPTEEEGEQEPAAESAGDQGAEEDTSEDGSGAGTGDRELDPQEETLEEALERASKESYENVKEELQERVEAVREEEKSYTYDHDDMERVKYHSAPDPELLTTVERCKDEFRAMSERISPGWHTSQRYGKLNHRQYAKALHGNEHVYRRWYEGVHDALDFEVVFLLDLSSSMNTGDEIRHASESLWVLRTVFDELDGVTTVLGFSNRTSMLAQRGVRAERQVAQYLASGGTAVATSLYEARRILSTSDKPLKFCVVITDGQFADLKEAQNTLDGFGNMVVLVGIRSAVSYYEKCRDVAQATVISDATGLVDVVKSFALHIAQERQIGRIYG